jgi:hypothetical protein
MTDESRSAGLPVSQTFGPVDLWHFGSDGPKTVEPEDLCCKGFPVHNFSGPLVSISRNVQAGSKAPGIHHAESPN